GINTSSNLETLSIGAFDILFDVEGTIIPIDLKTRMFNPEIDLKISSPEGRIRDLKIFEVLKFNRALEKYCGRFDFLKKEMIWKNAVLYMSYKDGVVQLKKGNLKTKDYVLSYNGSINVYTKALKLDASMVLSENQTAAVKTGVRKKAESLLDNRTKKYVSTETITNMVMNLMKNEEGKIYLEYRISGTPNRPKVQVVQPSPSSLKQVISISLKRAATQIIEDKKDELQIKLKDTIKKKIKINSDFSAKGSSY
ncbi:hypothetical protein ACFLRM_05745, partial [Acidobacteriota bacterium]